MLKPMLQKLQVREMRRVSNFECAHASLGESSIGCDSCSSRYHPTSVCLGLPNSIINAEKETSGRGAHQLLL